MKNNLNADNLQKNHTEFIKNNKLILKSQQRFSWEKHNVFTPEVNKVALTTNDHKRIQSFEQIK